MRAVKTVEVDYDGERVTITAGQTSVASDHPLVSRFPDLWEVEEGPVDLATNGAPMRSRSQLSPDEEARLIAQQGRIRRERLAQIKRDGYGERSPVTDEQQRFFDAEVHRILFDTPEAREDAAAAQLMNEVEAARAASIADENEDLSEWLDK